MGVAFYIKTHRILSVIVLSSPSLYSQYTYTSTTMSQTPSNPMNPDAPTAASPAQGLSRSHKRIIVCCDGYGGVNPSSKACFALLTRAMLL